MFAADEEAATLSTAHAAGEEITRMFPKFPVSFIFLPLTIFHVKWHTLRAAARLVGGWWTGVDSSRESGSSLLAHLGKRVTQVVEVKREKR